MKNIRRTSDDSLGARRSIRLSPSSIHVLESCKAGWVYTRQLLPKVSLEEQEGVTSTGSIFHAFAETDFDIDSLLAKDHIDEQVINEIQEYANTVKSRSYYKYPCQKEVKIEHPLHGSDKKWVINGFVDRRCETPSSDIIIVDYKTSWMADIFKDKKQVLAYGYIENKTNGTPPNQITVSVDYVKIREEHSFTMTNRDIEETEARFVRAFRTAEDLLDEMEKPGFDISKIPHSPASGVCTICPMKGMCIAYRVVVNAEISSVPIESTSSEVLYAELGERLDATSINSARADAIKRALMIRLKEGDSFMTDMQKEKKIIISPIRTVIHRDDMLGRVIPSIVKKAIKNVRFNDMIDTKVITDRVTSLMQSLLPKNLSSKDIPVDYQDEVLDLRREVSTSPYIKYKKLTKQQDPVTNINTDDDGII